MSPMVLCGALAILLAAPPVVKAPQDPPPSNGSSEPLLADVWSALDKEGRVTLTFTVASAGIREGELQGKTGYLVLTAPRLKGFPQMCDRTEIDLSGEIVTRLKKLGITDLSVHFKGRTVKATGKLTRVMYTGYPAAIFTTLTVERIEDIEVLPVAADAAKK